MYNPRSTMYNPSQNMPSHHVSLALENTFPSLLPSLLANLLFSFLGGRPCFSYWRGRQPKSMLTRCSEGRSQSGIRKERGIKITMRRLLGLEQTCHQKDMPFGVQNPSFQIPLFSSILSLIKLLVDRLFPLRKLRGT